MDSGVVKDYLLKAMDALNREIVVISRDLKVLSASRNATDTWGRDIAGKSCHQLFFDRTAPCKNCPAGKALHETEPASDDTTAFLGRDRSTCFPVLSNGEIDALVMFDMDLPHLGKLEEELQQSNSFLENMLLSAADGVIAAETPTGKIIIYNDAAAEVWGYGVDEALDHLNVTDLYPGNGARDVMKKIRSDEYGGKGKVKGLHVDVRGKSGDLIPISLYASIIYEGDEEVGSIGFFHDLRERLQMEKELEKTQVQLLQAEKMASLGKLAAGVAHQLNNPLGGITLYAKLILEEYDLVDEAREDMQRILKDAERCRDTVKELLEFARQTRYFMQPHDIVEAISRTLFLLESQSLFQNITIEKDLPPSLPLLTADIQQLNHLFMNIILNAAEAMDGKGVLTVRAYLNRNEQGIRVEVSDTGPGILEEDLPRIFEPFFTTKEEGKGTGLGLSLGYRIVETHGGTINASSKLGEGTTFHIEFPLNQAEDGALGDE